MSMTSPDNWLPNSLANGDSVSLTAAEIRFLKRAISQRMAKEHLGFDENGVGGEHLEGSARIYVADDAEALAALTKPDGATALDTDDVGRVALDKSSNTLNIWDGSEWQDYQSMDIILDERVVAHNPNLTRAIGTKAVVLKSGLYLVLSTLSTSTNDHLPSLGLFADTTLLDSINNGASDNHNHRAKAAALMGTLTVAADGTTTFYIKTNSGSVGLYSWKLIVAKIG